MSPTNKFKSLTKNVITKLEDELKQFKSLNNPALFNFFMAKTPSHTGEVVEVKNMLNKIDKPDSLDEVNLISSIYVKGYQSELIEKVVKILEQNITEDISVEFIAEELNMTRHTFLRRMKKITSYTAIGFIKHYRLQYASKKLKYSNYSIKEVAFLSGFRSISYFHSEFKRKYKVSPKKFQKFYC